MTNLTIELGEIISENSTIIGEGVQNNSALFSTIKRTSKSQFLFTLEELTSSGLSSDADITSLGLDLSTCRF